MIARKALTKARGKKRSATQKTGGDATGAELPPYVTAQLRTTAIRAKRRPANGARTEQHERLAALGLDARADKPLVDAIESIDPRARVPIADLPRDIRGTYEALKREGHRFHGSKVSLAWSPWWRITSPCGDRFGYLTPPKVRMATRLPFNAATITLVDSLGTLMGDAGRDTMADSSIPAGFTYVGQFVDHDITLDVSSSLDTPTNANTVPNMRTPALDLDSVYGEGPALDPFLYDFPTGGPATAIKMQLGSNSNFGPGGSAGSVGNPGGMKAHVDFDVPRVHNPSNPALSTLTAVIGDPRNDENLIVSQLHHAMLRVHNKVVDMLVTAGFTGDIFVEARKIVTHHYQWAVVSDFLVRVCGAPAVTAAMTSVPAPVGSPFRMPVEFAVAAYRFGHSMIRDNYWVNFNFPAATLGQVFQFIRKPRLPVFSNWVVDFNAFFDTGFTVPVNNKARKIDSVLANGLESLPGFPPGILQILAQRNLRRGLALGLPSGQGVAKFFGIPPMTAAQLQTGLPANEVAVLNASGQLLLKRTPLWYYVLRESAVLQAGDQLGPVGARIVADTFARMLKRDATSFVHVGGFTPMLPSATPGTFTFADLVNFAGVTQ